MHPRTVLCPNFDCPAKGAIVRCAFESLALKYRWTLERIEEILGRSLSTIHIVVGGSQNALPCQWAADATHRPMIAGQWKRPRWET